MFDGNLPLKDLMATAENQPISGASVTPLQILNACRTNVERFTIFSF
jgi:hypothetical protein